MSVSITVKFKKITITNKSENIIENINEIEQYTKRGCELTVFIFDPDSSNFHQYVFDYLDSSKLLPRKWLLNNILYSLTCDETKKNIEERSFNNILFKLRTEYNNLYIQKYSSIFEYIHELFYYMYQNGQTDNIHQVLN